MPIEKQSWACKWNCYQEFAFVSSSIKSLDNWWCDDSAVSPLFKVSQVDAKCGKHVLIIYAITKYYYPFFIFYFFQFCDVKTSLIQCRNERFSFPLWIKRIIWSRNRKGLWRPFSEFPGFLKSKMSPWVFWDSSIMLGIFWDFFLKPWDLWDWNTFHTPCFVCFKSPLNLETNLNEKEIQTT